jgi:phage terminase large subunit-like protein
VFCIDDINDDKNTESERENARVNRVLRETLMPMVEKARFSIFVQTPWTRKDALEVAKNMGVYTCVRTPVLSPDPDGEEIVVEKDGNILYQEKATLTWPERFDNDLISLKYKESGRRGFARMYLLDLAATEGQVLHREWLRRAELDTRWPVYFGIDYGSSADVAKHRDDLDFTAVGIVRKAPNGNRYIEGGVRERVSQAEAEAKLQGLARVYPEYLKGGIELDGRGGELYTTLIRNTNLKLLPMRTKGRSKGYRFEKIMAPYFEMGRVWISDADNDFIQAFMDEWLNWPNGDHDDCLDAVFWALAASGLFMESYDETVETVSAWTEGRKKEANPFSALGGARG